MPEEQIQDYISKEEFDDFLNWWKVNKRGWWGGGEPGYDINLLDHNDFTEWLNIQINALPKPKAVRGQFDVGSYWRFMENLIESNEKVHPTSKLVDKLDLLHQINDVVSGKMSMAELPDYDEIGVRWNKVWLSTLQREGQEYGNVIKYEDRYYDKTKGTPVTPDVAVREVRKATGETEQATAAARARREEQLQQLRYYGTLWNAEQQAKGQQAQIESQRQAQESQRQALRQFSPMGQRARLAEGWQAPPRNWIQAWQLQQAYQTNPWNQPASNRFDRWQELQRAEQAIGEASPSTEWAPSKEYLGALKDVAIAKEQYASALANETAYAKGGAGIESRMPALPPAPAWLPKFAPGQRPGQMISPEKIAPPSTQGLSSLNREEREMLAGYVDWSGGNWEDLEEQRRRMLPSNPYGRESWRPARQWA